MIKVKKSKIHGKGVFATEKIGKNKRIIEYTGEKITSKEADRRAGRGGSVWIFELNRNWCIDAVNEKTAAKWINHCCQPNCRSEIIDGHIWIIANRNILSGEELTYDYNFGANADEEGCCCGAPKCRGKINQKKKKRKKRI